MNHGGKHDSITEKSEFYAVLYTQPDGTEVMASSSRRGANSIYRCMRQAKGQASRHPNARVVKVSLGHTVYQKEN